LATLADGAGFPAWIPALLIVPAVILLAWANVSMYRSGDEFQRRKIAEAVLLAFVLSTALILAVGLLQFFLLPGLKWIFAFSILMLSWLVGTVGSAVRYRGGGVMRNAIGARRTERRWSQAELGKALGVSRQTVIA